MKDILDACCGSRMFWFDKNHPNAIYNDIRKEKHTLCDGRKLEILPDTRMDFTKLKFRSNRFKLVVFDPPHLKHIGKTSWMAKKYGLLKPGWEKVIKSGFDECWRVLAPSGILIFKWNESEIPVAKVLSVIDQMPLFGHRTMIKNQTIWMCFMKLKEKK